jgi:ribose transport system substrate-binding protein
VGLADLPQIVELIKEGVMESSATNKPMMDGYWSVLAMWQAGMGVNMPKRIDTGIVLVTKDMAQNYKGF